jgi:carotenoid cleavage dioxygenase
MAGAAKSEPTPFLDGLMAPVMDERDDAQLEIAGTLPAGLRGVFVRNGPNPQFPPRGAYHPFDGDGMLHAVYFENGRARYRNRWVESAGLRAERKRGRACFGSLSQFSFPEQDVMDEAGLMKNNANTHFVRHAGRYLALMEAAKPTELSRELETLGEYDFGGRLAGPMTAHPKIDPATGEMLFFGYSPLPPYLRYHVADASGALVHSVEIELPAPVMIHDFAITEHFVVFVDSPAVFDVNAMMEGKPAISWQPERGTRLGVLPRRGAGDEIRWFDVPTCNVVHFFNAWDTGTKLEIHGPAFDRMPGALQFDRPEQQEEPYPRRWRVDLGSGAVDYEQTDDRAGEFPRINDGFTGRRHRYMYNSMARDWAFGFNFNGVVKYDVETGAATEFIHPDTVVVGEHIFVPEAGGSREDDGWVLTMATDRLTERSELVVLDARDLAAGPIARVRMRRRVPIGFHANWFAE